MKILIRAYGSHLMGMGHLYRMEKLVSKLKEKANCYITLITRNFDESIDLYKNINADEVVKLSFEITQNEEIKYLKSISSNVYDICINDQLNTSLEVAEELRRISKKAISFDDNGEGNICFNNLLNVLYPSTKNLTNENIDFKYLIINNYTEHKQEYKLNKQVKSIFINQGAADTWGAIPDIINDLNMLDEDVSLVVLLGPAFNHFYKLSIALKNTNKKVIIYNKVDSVVEIAKSCDLAILGAGNTLFEIASLGMPIIASTREEKELITIKRLLLDNLVYSTEKLYQSDIQLSVKSLIDNFELRKQFYKRNRKIFKYNGLDNIINMILKDEKK